MEQPLVTSPSSALASPFVHLLLLTLHVEKDLIDYLNDES
jgi:hypothetical protein